LIDDTLLFINILSYYRFDTESSTFVKNKKVAKN